MTPRPIIAVDQVRFRKFYPVDRESPIFEVVLDGEVIFDVARTVDTDQSSEFEIAVHEGAAGLQITISTLNDIVHRAIELITGDEVNS